MKTAFIIHGTFGSPEGNWFPSMKHALGEKGYQVFVPEFPTPEHQSLESWLEVFEEYKTHLDEHTIFIAHSVGPSFVCSILDRLNQKVSACYFASGFLGYIGIHEFDTLNKSFVDKDFNWEKIKNNCEHFYMCHGSNDPYVPRENAQDLADKLGVNIDIIEGGGHLNAESGYTSFKYLLEKILEDGRIMKFEEIFNTNIYLSLTTIDRDFGTWASPVFFCRDGNTLYFASQKSSRHIQNIQTDNRVSFSIFDSHAPEGKGNGIQGVGEVEEIIGADIENALKIYLTDFLSLEDFKTGFYTLFQLKIQKIFILDPFSGADIRVEI